MSSMSERLDASRDFGDVFELVKRSAERSLGRRRAGLMLYLAKLPKHIGALNGQIGAKIAQQALDLVALAFAASAPTGHVALSSRRTTALLRLKVTIENALGDHSLRPVGAAAAAGISVRYANALLAEEGTSLERFIVSRRLLRCHQTLSDPAQAHRTVSDIAYSYGFSDPSHFTRRFKAQFGCSPSGCRSQKTAHAVGKFPRV